MAVSVQAAPPEADATQVAALINAERAENGLAPLAVRPSLEVTAERQAEEMARANFVGHGGPDGEMIVRGDAAGYTDWSFLGETVGAGQPTAAAAIAEWMANPEHRANLLAPQATDVGVGYAYNPSSRYGHYWAVEVGRSEGV
jgi:uncharacterized protein YkwD